MSSTENATYEELVNELQETIIQLNFLNEELLDFKFKDEEELERVKTKSEKLKLKRKAIIGTLFRREKEGYDSYQIQKEEISSSSQQ